MEDEPWGSVIKNGLLMIAVAVVLAGLVLKW